ncbi:pseudouridine synthase [Lichenihabitans psoromatis]|uniref:pseudouridine synthase n=1 Tax=Lichenihabitans psoromatis TaxID=2528642 RepID=UPI0015A8DBA2|nr:pseudouridine synthase [Lichenihabitans psoromatis]
MTDTTDNTRRPGRPARRFSQLQPLIRRVSPKSVVLKAASSDLDAAASAPAADVTPALQSDEARIAKVMARAGLCSRRDAESWILAGRVAVNGRVIESPALNIGPSDVITVDGSPIEKAERTRLFMFHKSRGLVTTAKDPEGRPTIYDALPDDLPRLVTVGRLDINTEGLMLLTNDGGLSRMLELPSTGWVRRYRVRANGSIDQGTLDELSRGVTIEGIDYAGIEAKLDRQQGANVWLTMGLREGKNREIKRVLEHLGLAVSRLIRVSFGPFQLGDLTEGAVEEVKTRILRDQLGPALAKEAGVDFEGPVPSATIVTREVRQTKMAERRGMRDKRDASTEDRARPQRASATEPRRHVSALRQQRDEAETDGPRRRTQRTATADRKGRAVAVERITTAARTPSTNAAPNRNARRFEQARSGDDARPGPGMRVGGTRRRDEDVGEEAAPRQDGRRPRTVRQADKDFRPARREAAPSRPPRFDNRDDRAAPRPARAARSDTGDARPTRSRDRDARPQGGQRDDRPRSDAPRFPRDSGRAGPSARAGSDERAPRGQDGKAARPRFTSGDKPEGRSAQRLERQADRPNRPPARGKTGQDGGFGGRSRSSAPGRPGGDDRPKGGSRPPRSGTRPGTGGGKPRTGGGGGRGRPTP